MNKKQKIHIQHTLKSCIGGKTFRSAFRFTADIGVNRKIFYLIKDEKFKSEERSIHLAAMEYLIRGLMTKFLNIKKFKYVNFNKVMKLRQSRKFWNFLLNNGYEIVK
jgi:hypothetical protein